LKTLIAFLLVFLLAGCSQHQQHAQEQKLAADNLHLMLLDLPDFIGKTVTLQVTATAVPSTMSEYLEVSITDESCNPKNQLEYGIAEFDRSQFVKDRMGILGFKDTKITITGRVVEYSPTSHPGIIVTSYRDGWN
jgi:hypothetical protein